MIQCSVKNMFCLFVFFKMGIFSKSILCGNIFQILAKVGKTESEGMGNGL